MDFWGDANAKPHQHVVYLGRNYIGVAQPGFNHHRAFFAVARKLKAR